ncbi:MAG: hypothetical protein ABFS09_12460 [Thermodesulfobacteriota bacterium]
MKGKKEAVKKIDKKDKKVTYTCVCNMEWRGTHDNEWGDCVCYPEEGNKSEK